jgi:peroxiredoxin
MTIYYNCKERKELAKAVSEIIGVPYEYKYMPTCAYQIDYFTIDKDGNLNFDDSADSDEIENLLESLEKRGFIAKPQDEKIIISMPGDFFDERSLENLKKIIENKSKLFRHAFGMDNTEIEINDKTVEFPWFEAENADDTEAYIQFISKLCEFAKNQKRVNSKIDESENEKYAMRCFLIRIGMVGEDYKIARKVILRNLKGSSAFKNKAR